MESVQPSDLLSLMDILVNIKKEDSAGIVTSFEDVLSQRTHKLICKINEDTRLNFVKEQRDNWHQVENNCCSKRWHFVICCLELLQLLNQSFEFSLKNFNKSLEKYNQSKDKKPLDAPPLSPDTLNVNQQKTVLSVIQFISGLGIYPYLLPGVGIPVERRSGFGHLLQESTEAITEEDKFRRLEMCINVLNKCCQQSSLSSLILSKHLNDLLAALFQLCYAPRSEQTKSDMLATPNDNCYSQILAHIVEHVYQPMLVRELLVLQGGPGPTKASKSLRHPSPSTGLQQAPDWLWKACGHMLSECLMRPKGIEAVLRGMLEGPLSSSTESVDWKKCDIVAKIIAHCPKSLSADNYYKHVCPQILDLLHCKDKLIIRKFLRVACSSITFMLKQQPELSNTYVISPLISPFVKCYQASDRGHPYVLTEEIELTDCVEDLHKVFVIATEPRSPLISQLQPIIIPLFELFLFCKSGVSHLRSPCQEILVTFFTNSSTNTSLKYLRQLAVHQSEDKGTLLPSCVQFKPGDQGGAKICVEFEKQERYFEQDLNPWNNLESRCRTMVELLASMKQQELAADFFLSILQELTDIISKDETESDNSSNSKEHDQLTHIEQKQNERVMDQQRNLAILNLLATMCETVGPECLTNTEHVLQFIKVSLERGIKICKSTEADWSGFDVETLTTAMGLLTVILGGAMEITDKDRDKTKELLPLLEDLTTHHTDPNVQQMAGDLRIAVATHGVVWADELKNSSKTSQSKKASEETVSQDKEYLLSSAKDYDTDKTGANKDQPSVQQAIPVLAPPSGGEGEKDKITSRNFNLEFHKKNTNYDLEAHKKELLQSAKDMKVTEHEYNSEVTSDYQTAMRDVSDSLIPVQGHGLIALRKLVEKNDPETVKNQDKVLKVFFESLQHVDTYIYLPAIQGLASLANKVPKNIIPILTNEFAMFGSTSTSMVLGKNSEIRMKLGEVLMKATRALGDMLPSYRDVLIGAYLVSTKDPDSLVRASSVSNLGEVCKLLRFSLGPVVHEVFSCCTSLLKSDTEVIVRRAAASVITLLLQGLGQDAFKVLEDVLRDMYRLLKFVVKTDKDETVQLHIQLSLEELDSIMKEYLFPKETFTKRIRVLDP